MTHANATLTPAGRLRLAKLVVEQGWTYARAAERFSVAITTVRRWATVTAYPASPAWSTVRPARTATRTGCPSAPSDGSWVCA
ncbi:hypothetical protein BJ993_001143 [Nocardioides aromaticivorans]|uniref:Transposase n=1 Tax=Nocardioides aromaticivorans TaxID=200618 RepID=A0A7Y9ZGX6_9ACTN|nr:hypothetical protein [Nocardioides aromaticivorans]